MSLHVERYGSTGPELVLLHGWGLSSAIWAPVVERLSRQYRLTLIDIPGLGRSPALDTGSLDALATALLAQAPQRAIWVGWSLGGALALKVASLQPARLSALMLVAATPCFVQREGWQPAMDPALFDAFAEGVAHLPAKTLGRFAMLQTQGSQSARTELKMLKQVIAQSEPDNLAGTLELLREDLRAELAELSVPASLVLGRYDQLVPASLADAVVQINPAIEVQSFEASAHLPFLSEPEHFDEALASLTRRTCL
ncbi:pimeloyl-ACP methyl ester esterase BioH [Marinobacterium sp. YM272]|uniref:pimeloyl-ACP methyl ester esterase BioH n=1 Tax=Marinobacterium sp. YM272 TaxID=3421654 RepID=UPI003D7F5B44